MRGCFLATLLMLFLSAKSSHSYASRAIKSPFLKYRLCATSILSTDLCKIGEDANKTENALACESQLMDKLNNLRFGYEHIGRVELASQNLMLGRRDRSRGNDRAENAPAVTACDPSRFGSLFFTYCPLIACICTLYHI